MTEYQDYDNEEFTVTGANIRKTFVDGERRFSKYILQVDKENIESMSMKLEEYYIEEGETDIDGVRFDTEEAEAEPVKPEDLPEIVKEIQSHLNEKGEVKLQATITVAKNEDNANWFINPENFEGIQVVDNE